MSEWDQMAEYVSRLDDGDETKLRGLGNNSATSDGGSNGTFFRAVLFVRMRKVKYIIFYVELVLLFCLFHHVHLLNCSMMKRASMLKRLENA